MADTQIDYYELHQVSIQDWIWNSLGFVYHGLLGWKYVDH